MVWQNVDFTMNSRYDSHSTHFNFGTKMEFKIVEKNQSLNLTVESKQTGPKTFYFGAGWDMKGGQAVDLDLVVLHMRDGKEPNDDDLVYFGNRNAVGTALSEDNTTGEGDGDDESVVINVDELPSDVTCVAVGIAAYTGADLHTVDNAHFRVCDGNNEHSPQIAEVKFYDAVSGETALLGFFIKRVAGGFQLENVESYSAAGNGTRAIHAVAELAVNSVGKC